MENPGQIPWDAARYQELNDYFRLKIKTMLESDPYLQDLVKEAKGLQLEQLTDRMSERDQLLWKEFLALDQLKFQQDLYNHLEGRGTPFNSRTGFRKPGSSENGSSDTW
ncbi:hypothetical protein [Adhaeribacter soli]|uniref:Uncharacterized protein n=1 Tax=Adhaeribacter soli TaxID=2607655 RepID=A0A5N1J4X4_9BACT|nr:hypothetical protein [Adhaeribacter soli]KAA9345740.1 hypothetical protein F0P94_01245 [Adhaeribacter soli]